MFKRITKLGWFTIFLIIFLILAGMSPFTHTGTKKIANQSERITDIAPKEKVPSQYSDIQITLETKEKNDSRLSLQRLQTDSEAINDGIDKWGDKQKHDFLDDKVEESDGEKHSSLNISANIDKITNSYYQIRFTKKESDETDRSKIFNVDIENDRILELNDVLKMDDDDSLEAIQKHAKENVDDADMTDHIEEVIEDPDQWDWTINNDAFTLNIDVADESHPDKEPITVDVSLDDLYLNLNEKITSIIDMSDDQEADMNDAIEKEKERKEKERKEQEKKEKEEQKAKEKAEQKEADRGTPDDDSKYVALTFDDGPSDDVTPRVLDTLADHDAVATFFMIGDQVDAFPDMAKQVADAGHEIGNHTKDHPDLTTLDPDSIQDEINSTSDRIEKATGTRPVLARPPYGASNDDVKNVADDNGISLINWSIDSQDWDNRNADVTYNEITNHMTSGAIVLMHDVHPTTADQLPDLLSTLEDEGYQFVTISQLLEMQDSSGAGPHYGKAGN